LRFPEKPSPELLNVQLHAQMQFLTFSSCGCYVTLGNLEGKRVVQFE
jgi:hypothetical protein